MPFKFEEETIEFIEEKQYSTIKYLEMTRRPVYLFCFLFPPLFWAVCQVGSLLPNQGSNPYTLQWKHRVLTTGLPGKNFAICLLLLLKQITTNSMVQNNTTIIPYSSICQKSAMSLTGINQGFQQGCIPFQRCQRKVHPVSLSFLGH